MNSNNPQLTDEDWALVEQAARGRSGQVPAPTTTTSPSDNRRVAQVPPQPPGEDIPPKPPVLTADEILARAEAAAPNDGAALATFLATPAPDVEPVVERRRPAKPPAPSVRAAVERLAEEVCLLRSDIERLNSLVLTAAKKIGAAQ